MGDAKVLDFGLARRTDPQEFDKQAAETITSDAGDSLAGTFPYMAPEQLEAGGITPHTDISSLGIVLYELAAGARPFHGTTLFQLCTAISREQLPSLPAHVPSGLATVIERCLEKDPARRYQRAGEVCAALQAMTSGQRGTVEVSRDRHKLRWLAVAVVVVLLGAAGALAVYRGRSVASERRIGAVAAQPVLGVLSSSASSNTEQAAAYGTNPLRQEFWGKRMLGGVDVPEVGADDPPAFAVPEEFEAVNAAAFYFAVW